MTADIKVLAPAKGHKEFGAVALVHRHGKHHVQAPGMRHAEQPWGRKVESQCMAALPPGFSFIESSLLVAQSRNGVSKAPAIPTNPPVPAQVELRSSGCSSIGAGSGSLFCRSNDDRSH